MRLALERRLPAGRSAAFQAAGKMPADRPALHFARDFVAESGTYKTMNRFPDDVVAWIAKSKILGIRAGSQPHRIIGIWAVVVERRVFVRSWSMKERSWWRTFLEDPAGIIEVDGKQIPIRAVRTRSERLKDAIDEAYAAKYNTPGSLQYVKDFRAKKRRDTTTELAPRA